MPRPLPAEQRQERRLPADPAAGLVVAAVVRRLLPPGFVQERICRHRWVLNLVVAGSGVFGEIPLRPGMTCWFAPGAAYRLATARGCRLITVGCTGPEAAGLFQAGGRPAAGAVAGPDAAFPANELWRVATRDPALAAQVAPHLVRLWLAYLAPPARAVADRGRRQVEQAQQLLARHRGLGIAGAARRVGLTPTHLGRLFLRHEGLTPTAWFVRLRLDRAHALIDEGWPLARIAAELGFADASAFGKAFRRWTGQPPAGCR